MTQNTYEAAIASITGMCNITPEMTSFDLVKRIGAIQYACEQAVPANLVTTEKASPKPRKMGRLARFWEALKAEYREYLLHAYQEHKGQEYKYSDLYSNPGNPGGMHKAISICAKQAKVGIVVHNNGQGNGHRRHWLDADLCAFIEQQKVTA